MKTERRDRETHPHADATIRAISAVSLATHDMARAVRFYRSLGFELRYGGEGSSFTSFHAGSSYLNLIAVPADQEWSWWGRVILHVSEVDLFYDRAIAAGLKPDGAPRDAAWGERFFHLADPDGHELSFATPLGEGQTPGAMTKPREQLTWDVTPELYRKIRRMWLRHSIAEDQRDIAGLLDTLTEDCVYEVVPTGERWEGHQGARTFYQSFLGAFPDVKFQLLDIVIGPQGVMEVAEMTGTQQDSWAGQAPTGRPIRLLLIIHFPWNQVAGKFAGETVYFDRGALVS